MPQSVTTAIAAGALSPTLPPNLQAIRVAIFRAILITFLINACAMLSPVINEGDAIVYAALSQHIALTGNWSDLILGQQEWLDKPHFPFWMTALSFKLLGVSAWTYLLPGYLFHLLGGYFTYRLARLLYSADIALVSLLLYASALSQMLTSTDIRAEAYLSGSITAAAYYWLRLEREFRWKYLIGGALAAAISLMTKGVFTLVTIASGVFGLWVYGRNWRGILSLRWIGLAVSIVVFTTPELVSLYLQFDAHPEKLVFGRTGVSGIWFFIWDSQFGRFFNSGPIKNVDGSPLFYVHVFLWAFLPWVGVFMLAVYSTIRSFGRLLASEREAAIFLASSFCITFAIFSATSFQGDYYIVILFPFGVILCARTLWGWLEMEALQARLVWLQIAISVLVLGLTLALAHVVGNAQISAFIGLILAVFVLWQISIWRGKSAQRGYSRFALFAFPVFAINLLYIFLQLMTALAMTRYGVAYNVSRNLRENPDLPVYAYKMDSVVPFELALYSQRPCYPAESAAELPSQGSYFVLLRDSYLSELDPALRQATPVLQGHWINHKTGILPHTLQLARGDGPLENMRVIRVGAEDKN